MLFISGMPKSLICERLARSISCKMEIVHPAESYLLQFS